MYQSAVVEYASANHATFSREEKLSKPLPRATFPCSGTVFYPLEMQKTLNEERKEVVGGGLRVLLADHLECLGNERKGSHFVVELDLANRVAVLVVPGLDGL